MKKEYLEHLNYITQDVSNLKDKPYLKTALASHLRQTFKELSYNESRLIVSDYYRGLK